MAAPVNAVLLWSVPPGLRPFALAAAEFSQHALGDIPSPPALGWLQVPPGLCSGLGGPSGAGQTGGHGYSGPGWPQVPPGLLTCSSVWARLKCVRG